MFKGFECMFKSFEHKFRGFEHNFPLAEISLYSHPSIKYSHPSIKYSIKYRIKYVRIPQERSVSVLWSLHISGTQPPRGSWAFLP